MLVLTLSSDFLTLLVFILLLSSFLVMLGSIPLTSLSYSKKPVSQRPTSLAPSNILSMKHTAIPSPTVTSTPNTIHAPILNYPLFNGNPHIPEIALTFDDGPNPFYTPQILAILHQYGIKATFFDVGYLVKNSGFMRLAKELSFFANPMDQRSIL